MILGDIEREQEMSDQLKLNRMRKQLENEYNINKRAKNYLKEKEKGLKKEKQVKVKTLQKKRKLMQKYTLGTVIKHEIAKKNQNIYLVDNNKDKESEEEEFEDNRETIFLENKKEVTIRDIEERNSLIKELLQS